ncbi:hypothetical protein P8452_25599 [Trifolium repens]|nr:hypothetical protein P8452_25599 [Trifolium repens]
MSSSAGVRRRQPETTVTESVQKNMNSVGRCLSSLFRQSGCATEPFSAQLQQCRGIRVQVYNGNLEGALALMQRHYDQESQGPLSILHCTAIEKGKINGSRKLQLCSNFVDDLNVAEVHYFQLCMK